MIAVRGSMATTARPAFQRLLCIAGIAIAGPVAAQTPRSASEPPAGSQPLVQGPGGHMIVAQREALKDAPQSGILIFRLYDGSNTRAYVLGANKTFDTSRLPATFGATLDSGETCTATLIGPQVLLTAAHCVDRKTRDPKGRWQTYGGELQRADRTPVGYIRNCDMAPAYAASDPRPGRPRNEQDFALCEIREAVSAIPGETIARDAESVALGSSLMIVGYGCTEQDLANGQITAGTKTSGLLNVGLNTVSQGGSSGWIGLRGTIGAHVAILCPGDSGGGAFAHASLEDGQEKGWRVVAVNSAVGPMPGGTTQDYVSYLAPLSDPAFCDFLKAWTAQRASRRKVCGVALSAANGNCRS